MNGTSYRGESVYAGGRGAVPETKCHFSQYERYLDFYIGRLEIF